MGLWVIQEVGPVGVCLHVLEFKELSQAENQDVLTNLNKKEQKKTLDKYLYEAEMKERVY